MEITKIYPHTKYQKYKFLIADNHTYMNSNEGFVVTVHEWSETNNKFIFKDVINQETYTNLNSDETMFFDTILNDLESDNNKITTNLNTLLDQNNIEYMSFARAIIFSDYHNADKCAKLMSHIFK